MADTSLAARILNLRLLKKMQQKEIAYVLGLPISTYRSYEYGKKTPGKLAMIELIRRVEAMEATK